MGSTRRRLVLTTGSLILGVATMASSASAAPGTNTLYYTGAGGRGAGPAHDRGAYVMTDDDYAVPGRQCSSARSVPSSRRAFTQLVGYSLGRVGPAYYLQQMEQRHVVSGIRNVVLLDPGANDELFCDSRSGAGRTYATWLRQNGANRLTILVAGASAKDNYNAVRRVYAQQLLGTDVDSKVLFCAAPNVAHSKVPSKFSDLIGGRPFACPSGSTPTRLHVEVPLQVPPNPGTAAPIAVPGYQPAEQLQPVPAGGSSSPAQPFVAPSISVSQGGGYGCSGCSALNVSVHDFPTGTYTYTCHDNSGSGGSDSAFYSHAVTVTDPNQSSWPGAFCYDSPGYTVSLTMNGVTSNSVRFAGSSPAPAPAPAPPPMTYSETAGGVAHTWTNYTNAGGYEGPLVGPQQTIEIACKLTGFRVADGNTWWYRIAQSPWSNQYYVSADAFYNNGRTSGSLQGTPFVDNAVANC